nr:hypothetical protein [Tanacetum cinerariifolium]
MNALKCNSKFLPEFPIERVNSSSSSNILSLRKQTKRVTTSRKKESLRSNNVCNLYISREFEATQAVEAMQAVKEKETCPQLLRSGSSVKRDAQSAYCITPEVFDLKLSSLVPACVQVSF